MRLPSALALTFALTLPLLVSAAPGYRELMQQAADAAKAGDQALFLAKLEEARPLRPDSPRLLLNLARAYAGQARPDDALAALQRLADMGLQFRLAEDPRLAALKDLPRFQALASQIAAGPAATGDTSAFTLEGITGIIESGLVDPATGDWYFGDVRERCIWRRQADGRLARFTSADDDLDGVFKLALSPDRQTLWAATSAVGVMTGTDAEDGKRAALVALDFATGRVRSRHPVPADGRKHLLGDFVLAADGALYATDSFSPVIWRLPAGSPTLEPWLESDEFLNLQGLAFGPDERTLFVADYSNGLWRINVATKTPALLPAPANATFFGLDGLYPVPGGLLAVQNGVSPQRVLRIDLSSVGSPPAATSPARSGHPSALGPATAEAPTLQESPPATRIFALGRPGMTDLALGHIFGGRFHFVGDSGWALYDPPPASPPAPRTVTLLSLPLD